MGGPVLSGDNRAVVARVSQYLRLPGQNATAAVISKVRERVVAWVRQSGLDEEQTADVGLAVYEAMANVVDHAYEQPGGLFDLYAYRHDGQVTVTVTDRGRWKQPTRDKASLRGRGLLLMDKLAREFELTSHTRGTIVRMSWRPRWLGRPTLTRFGA